MSAWIKQEANVVSYCVDLMLALHHRLKSVSQSVSKEIRREFQRFAVPFGTTTAEFNSERASERWSSYAILELPSVDGIIATPERRHLISVTIPYSRAQQLWGGLPFWFPQKSARGHVEEEEDVALCHSSVSAGTVEDERYLLC